MKINDGLSRLFTVYGTALILMFFSEYFFLNEGPVQDVMKFMSVAEDASILGYVEFTLFYTLFAVWLLLPIFYFKIRGFWALYLAGGFFGIATEGLVIPLIYTESLTWPALSWHVLADVILGWYVVRHVLIKNQPLYTVLLAGAMGLFWAFWVPWTHIGEEPFIPEPSRFTGFALFASAHLFCGYSILNLLREKQFKPTRIELAVFGGITLALWVPMLINVWFPMLSMKPVNSLLLPLYLGVAIYTLYRHSKAETRKNLFSVFRSKIAWWNMCILTLMPITAISVYPFVYRHQLFPPTAFIVGLMNMSAYVLTVIAVFMLCRDIKNGDAEQVTKA
ncbi:hypothetical protein GF373_06740 [bacterium]|nr:hypothetical protein [bacterium]